jgi:hypothetical protein
VRSLVAALVISAVLVWVVEPSVGLADASAPIEEFDPCKRGRGEDAVECLVKQAGSLAQDVIGAAHSSLTPSGPRPIYVPYPRLTTGPDGRPCVVTGYYPAGARLPSDAAPEEVPSDDRVPGVNDFSLYYQTYPPCPEEEGAAGVADTPAAFAARFWERVPMPKPDPHIAPGWAIVGKTAYLETNGVTTMTHNSDSPFGPLRIVATGRYYVDWGDGERTGPHSVEGRPWPHGQITHEYQWAGTYDVVVTQRWTATWSLAGQSGILRELRTTGTIDDFPARQIQAVVRS